MCTYSKIEGYFSWDRVYGGRNTKKKKIQNECYIYTIYFYLLTYICVMCRSWYMLHIFQQKGVCEIYGGCFRKFFFIIICSMKLNSFLMNIFELVFLPNESIHKTSIKMPKFCLFWIPHYIPICLKKKHCSILYLRS